jgi:Flp pilus assembly protein TadG
MIRKFMSFLRDRAWEQAKDESGQALVMIALLMVLLLGFMGLVIDFGRTYIAFRQLQTSTDAAALAGAGQLPNATATTVASTYSGLSGSKNGYSNLSGVTMVTGYPKVECLTTLTNEGIACVAPEDGNALFVKQQVTIPLYIGALFGTPTVTLTATAAAAARGAVSSPYNVAIILDATDSMVTNTDSNCSNQTREACALEGLRVLLQNMAPCAAQNTTCTITNDVSANSNDRVSLFQFPNVTDGTVNKAYTCPTSKPTPEPYTFPSATSTSYAPSGSVNYTYVSGGTTPTYQITPFWSDYKTSNSTSTLNPSSNISQYVGGGSCSGETTQGGEGTYYAGVIYAAAGAVYAEGLANPGSQNVIIILTDGDANASSGDLATSTTGYSATSGTYPSLVDQCTQAVTAAQYAASLGIRVYAVAYGAETTGCATDPTTSIYYNNPCEVMKNMASSSQYFYSDYAQSGSGIDATCQSSANPTTNLDTIFTDIAGDFTLARLIPISTT